MSDNTSTQPYVRPTWDEYFMEICHSVAKRSTCDRGREHHGCVIVKDKNILATGYVGSPPGQPHCDDVGHLMKTVIHEDGHQSQHCMRTIHMEINAICQAAKRGIALDGGTVYVQYTPCSNCAKAIVSVGIKRVVCTKKYHAGDEETLRAGGVEVVILSPEVEKYANQ